MIETYHFVLFPELKSLRGLKTIRIIPSFKLFNDNGISTYIFKWSNWFVKNKYLQIKGFNFFGNILFKKYIDILELIQIMTAR